MLPFCLRLDPEEDSYLHIDSPVQYKCLSLTQKLIILQVGGQDTSVSASAVQGRGMLELEPTAGKIYDVQDA